MEWYRFFFAAQVLSVYKILKTDRINLIHAHWILPQGMAALLACKLAGIKIPVLCTSHGGDLYGLKAAFFTKLKRIVLNKSSAITVVSRAMKREVKKMGISSGKVRVVPMGVDLQKRFVPPVKKQRRNSILFVGRLVEKKGLEYLIKALPLIVAKHPLIKLDIVGEGPERKNCEEQATRLGLSGQVCFHGALRQEYLPDFYQNADIVVFPSIVADDGDQEGFGLVLVEAMGCGCAVVVTDLQAMEDIVSDGQTGMVILQKDSLELAEKIVGILDNPKRGREIGRKGREYVLKRYDWGVISNRYERFIKELFL